MTIQLKLKPFCVPNYVLVETPLRSKQDGISFNEGKFSIKDIDIESLSQLCDQFRASIFEKANKKDPKAA